MDRMIENFYPAKKLKKRCHRLLHRWAGSWHAEGVARVSLTLTHGYAVQRMEWRVKEIEGWFATSLKFFTLRLAAPLGAKSSSGAIQNQVITTKQIVSYRNTKDKHNEIKTKCNSTQSYV